MKDDLIFALWGHLTASNKNMTSVMMLQTLSVFLLAHPSVTGIIVFLEVWLN